MKSLERRVEQAERKLELAHTVLWWEREDLRDAVDSIMSSPVAEPDKDAWTANSIASSPWLMRIVDRFGTPTWLDDAWHWPEHCERPGDVDDNMTSSP